MKKKTIRSSILFLLLLTTISVVTNLFAASSEFTTRESQLKAVENLLRKERKDPWKRVQLLIDWVTIKESYEQATYYKQSSPSEVARYQKSKLEVALRLQHEIDALEKKAVDGLDLSHLDRLVAYRFQELKKHDLAIVYFEKLSKKTPEDQMAYGDSLILSHRADDALTAYTRAEAKSEIRPLAAYKKAWAYVQKTDFASALRNFNVALEDNPNAPARLKEEAFRDRLRPYVEIFSHPTFGETQARELRNLAQHVRPDSNESQKLYVDALRALIDLFDAKGSIPRAQEAFQFYKREHPDSLAVLMASAPFWLKTYRSELNHDAVERILKSLPSEKVALKPDEGDTLHLRVELNNTAAFYETLVNDSDVVARKADIRAKQILTLAYEKYLTLFPEDHDVDLVRVNYSKLQLIDGDAEKCLKFLGERTRPNPDPKIEEVALNVEGKCELRVLDQLYAKTWTDSFYQKLDQALAVNKIYDRADLGISPEKAFEDLALMLMGVLRKYPEATLPRETLLKITNAFPFSKNSDLFHHLLMVRAELNFQDLATNKNITNEAKSAQFYEIYTKAPPQSEVAEKALQNSILTAAAPDSLDRCRKFRDSYPDKFHPGNEIFDRCVRLAEQNLDLAKEYSFWKVLEVEKTTNVQLHLGLLELALGMSTKGRARIEKINTATARKSLETWDGVLPEDEHQKPTEREEKKFKALIDDTNFLLHSFRRISFSRIETVVPEVIEKFKIVDAEWVRFYKAYPPALMQARALEKRALIAVRMRDWIKNLPEPPGLAEKDLETYRARAAKVVQPWEDKAVEIVKQCGEVAYTLTPYFQQSQTTVCPEATAQKTIAESLKAWEKTRVDPKVPVADKDVESEKVFQILMKAGKETDKPLQARYFLLRANDFTFDDAEKAEVQLSLAKLTNKERYWLAASALNGNLPEPIEHFKAKSERNPFYTHLYEFELEFIEKKIHFTGSLPEKSLERPSTDAGEIKAPKN